MKLQIDELIEVDIYAKYKWNATHIAISKNEEYEFTALGVWKDLIISADAEGYTNWYMRLFDAAKRARQRNWFALMGSLDQTTGTYFYIGKYNKIIFENGGSLFCFANDINGFYWNNSGRVTLHVKRLK